MDCFNVLFLQWIPNRSIKPIEIMFAQYLSTSQEFLTIYAQNLSFTTPALHNLRRASLGLISQQIWLYGEPWLAPAQHCLLWIGHYRFVILNILLCLFPTQNNSCISNHGIIITKQLNSLLHLIMNVSYDILHWNIFGPKRYFIFKIIRK